MGACCSKYEPNLAGGSNFNQDEIIIVDEDDENYDRDLIRDDAIKADCGARVRLQGYSRHFSMFSQQGRKGINQDAMTVWEDFTGEKDTYFCGVFDGHGPAGHLVARHVRDVLPSKLSSALRATPFNNVVSEKNDNGSNENNDRDQNPNFDSWKASFIQCFEEIDEELRIDKTIETYCSGTTAVTVLKRGSDLMIANLGDSRAILCTRGNKNQLVAIQLTVDLKPNLPDETERIKNCKGRVFAAPEEPDVYRIWLPDDNSPGLAMARAFGDFCLKDYGLIATPQVSHRKLTDNDEFIVLATDGIWDVLSNKEVIGIVASTRKRSMAAKLLVARAVREWMHKYPTSKIDDCAVTCLFFKSPASLTKSKSDATYANGGHRELFVSHSFRSAKSDEGLESVNGKIRDESNEWSALDGVSRVNSILKLPRFGNVLSRRWKSGKDFDDVDEF